MSLGRRRFLAKGCSAATLGLLPIRMLFARQDNSQNYEGTLTELGILEEGDTLAYVINENNHVVGTSGTRGFVWSPELGMRDLGDLGGGATNGYNMNNENVVVGESIASNGETHAFVYTKGEMHDLGTLGGTYSTAEEINDSGIVVGASRDRDGVQHAFWGDLDRGLNVIPNLGGGEAYAVSVNSLGQVCGFSRTRDEKTHAFIYDEQRGVVDIGTLGGDYCEGWQINDKGVACGISKTVDGDTHGFVWIPKEPNALEGVMLDIGSFNGLGTYANFVSEDGIILAMTEDENIPLVARIDESRGMFVSALSNPFYSMSALTDAGGGFQNEMRVQAPCAINSLGAITGWGVMGGAQRAYVLTPVPL